jgi:hypothetical protein
MLHHGLDKGQENEGPPNRHEAGNAHDMEVGDGLC